MKRNYLFTRWAVDAWLLFPIIVLLSLGLVVLYSLSLSSGDEALSLFYRQLWFIPIGFAVFFLISFVDYRWFYHYAEVLYWFGIILLIAVLIFGEAFRGTTGWFVVGSFVWQPVELVKILWVVWVASYFTRANRKERPLKSLMVSVSHLALVTALVMMQPDLGSALLFVAVWLGVIVLLQFPRRYLIGFLLILFTIALISWFVILADYQKERIYTFVNPQSDPLGSGYNIRQSIIAIGSGQLWGRGIAGGTQTQLRFLPEGQTDFILAVIGEELGFIGIMTVLASWLLLFRWLYLLGVKTKDNFSRMLIAGFFVLFATQVAVNIGMNLGLMPVTGLGLPFVSYGRSSLLAVFISFGIMTHIARTVHGGVQSRVFE